MTSSAPFDLNNPRTWNTFIQRWARQSGSSGQPSYLIQARWHDLSESDLIEAGRDACVDCWEKSQTRTVEDPKSYARTAVLYRFERLILKRRKRDLPKPPDVIAEFLNSLGDVTTAMAIAAHAGLKALTRKERAILIRRHLGETQVSLAEELDKSVKTIQRWEEAAREKFLYRAWEEWLRHSDDDVETATGVYTLRETRRLLRDLVAIELAGWTGWESRWLPHADSVDESQTDANGTQKHGDRIASSRPIQHIDGLVDVSRALTALPEDDRGLLRLWAAGFPAGDIAGLRGEDESSIHASVHAAEDALLAAVNGSLDNPSSKCRVADLLEVEGEIERRGPQRPRPQIKNEAADAADLQALFAEHGESSDIDWSSPRWVTLNYCIGCGERRKAGVLPAKGLYNCFKPGCLRGTAEQIRAQLAAPAA